MILGHLNRSPDLRLHRQLAESGAYLAFDGPSRANHATDHHMVDSLVALAESGHGDQLLLGGDTITAAARGNPGMPYLLRVLSPRLSRELGPDLASRLFTDNPARALAAAWRQNLGAAPINERLSAAGRPRHPGKQSLA